MTPSELIASWAKKGATLGVDCGRMCDDCAFKSGTEANNDEYLMENVAYGAMQNPDAIFYCHKTSDHGILIDKTKVCAGFMYAKEFWKPK